jgi:ATP-binding cassette, subfamily B, bacterial
VGNNGAGKTTFVKLLARIYDPTEGRILINGVDIRDVAIKEWWSYLGIMFQDFPSYDFIVKDAIGIGRPDAPTDIERVKQSAHVSQAHSFIKEWKDQYDQQLGVEFKGKEPSKGQRQKLAIARVVYRNAFVMVLDEPTASVDAQSEAKIFDSLENLSKDTTALLISHDFSTISECDEIFVLEKGELKEQGTHKDLMKLKGLYFELYSLQAERFKK